MHANLSVFVPHLGCPCRCSFCDQKTISGTVSAPSPQYVTELCLEQVPRMVEKFGEKNCELAFFGGSFTAIDRDYMISLLKAAQPFVGKDKLGGIRISTRPDAIDAEILQILHDYNVTAIELGCQSMSDEVLSFNNRGHSAEDTVNAARLIKDFGFSLGVQMMVGLPKDTDEACIDTARKLCLLGPDTVRVYPVVVLEGTPMAQWYKDGSFVPMELDHCVDLCAQLMEIFTNYNVQIIRVGLHAQDELQQKRLAGPYHPAFRQLCTSRVIYRKVAAAAQTGPVTIAFPPKMRSDVVGQNKSNLVAWQQQGLQVTLQQSEECTDLMILEKEK